MRSASSLVVVLVSLFTLVSQTARAQTPLADLIGETYVSSQNQVLTGIGNSGQFNFDLAGSAFDAGGALSSALVLETGAFPIGSSSGGFTYFFDATSGAAVRSSPSFGPAFAERPLTSGRGKLNVGLTFLHRSFKQLEGKDLEDGSLKFFALVTSSATGSSVDVMESTLSLDVKSDTTTLFATYGVMDKLDVSLALPIQHVSMDAAFTSQLLRFGPSSGIANSQIPAARAAMSRSASGIGDIAVRAKYNVLNAGWGAVAAGLDQRLPTGDEEDLLGTGRPRTQIYAAVTSKMPKVFPHANFGYTFKTSRNDDSRFVYGSEFSYAAGAEYILNPRLTVIGDVIGRSLANEGRLQDQTTPINLVATNSSAAQVRTVTELTFEPGLRLNSTLLVAGAKFNPTSTFIISAHVLFPTTKAGIKSNPTPVIGIDYSF